MVENAERKTPGGPEIRVARDKAEAILILYPLEHQDNTGPMGSDKPYIGFAISFPGNKNAAPVRYRVNSVYQGQMNDS